MTDQNIDPIDALTDAGLKPIIIDEHTDFDALPKFNAFTICDVLIHLRPDLAEASAISGAEFEKAGLPMFGGCYVCGAAVSAYNACPGKNGYLVGTCCATPENVYATVEEFLATRKTNEANVCPSWLEVVVNQAVMRKRSIAKREAEPKDVWTCDECGSQNVQGTAWIHLNSNTIVQGDPPDDDYWCEDCDGGFGAHVTATCGPRKTPDHPAT